MNESPSNRVTAAPHRYSFGEFVLDLQRGALQISGVDVALRPKSFKVLCHLVRHHGELVSKDSLMAAVWPTVIVSEGSLAQCLADIRRALNDRTRTRVRTVPRRGYLFDMPVLEHGKRTECLTRPREVKLRHNRFPYGGYGLAAALVLAVTAIWWPGEGALTFGQPDQPSAGEAPSAFAFQGNAVQPRTPMGHETLSAASPGRGIDGNLGLSRTQQAWGHYLRGRFLYNRRNEGDIEHAMEHFQRALDLDPELAQASTGLAGRSCCRSTMAN